MNILNNNETAPGYTSLRLELIHLAVEILNTNNRAGYDAATLNGANGVEYFKATVIEPSDIVRVAGVLEAYVLSNH